MIINSLCEYYDILADDDESGISPFGFEVTTAAYRAVLSRDGDLVGITSLINQTTKKPKEIKTPTSMKKSGIAASPVCDNFAYIFGISGEKGQKNLEQIKFSCAKTLHLSLFKCAQSEEAKAIVNFFKKWGIEKAWENEHILGVYSEKGNAFNGNIIFSLQDGVSDGDVYYFHENREIINLWFEQNKAKQGETAEQLAQCSVTGEVSAIARLHPQLSGVKGTIMTGASLVCFKKDADASYNMEQSYNAAVSQKAVFKYTTALDKMLRSSRQKLFIGDDTTVFWQ